MSHHGKLGVPFVLFVSAGHCARALMAEAYLRQAADGRIEALGAVRPPVGVAETIAFETLHQAGIRGGALALRPLDQVAEQVRRPFDLIVRLDGEERADLPPHAAVWNWRIKQIGGGGRHGLRGAYRAALADIRTRIDTVLLPALHPIAA